MRSLIISTLLGLLGSTSLGAEFAFQPIDFHSEAVTAFNVSGDGSVVVGFSWDFHNQLTAIRWTSQGGVEPLFNGAARGVSPDGKVIVGISDSKPVYWTQETGVVPLSGFPEDRRYGMAMAVSNTGTIYGHVQNSTSGWNNAFSWTATEGPVFLTPDPKLPNTSVYAVSNDDQIAVGEAYFVQGAGLAARWSEECLSTDFGYLPVQSYASTANDITPDGRFIVGKAVQQAYRWSEATGIVSLVDGADGLFFNEAYGISGDGSVIVGDGYRSPNLVATYWNGAAGAISIADLLQRQGITEFANWGSNTATGISDDGRRIVGYGVNPNGIRTGWVVDLPASGDATFDNIIDGADYVAWADHFLETDTNWSQGDFNFDGKTDAVDYVIWADHFSPGVTVSTSIVPEPSSRLLMWISAVLLAIVGTRSCRSRMSGKSVRLHCLTID